MLVAVEHPWRRAMPRAALVLVGASVFAIAYADGAAEIERRDAIAIAVWWIVSLGTVFGFWSVWRLRRAAAAAVAAGGALVLWTLASVVWAPSAEDAFSELNRTALYVGVLLLVLLAAARTGIGVWLDALALAISAIAAVALASRFFPDAFPQRDLAVFLPSSEMRLSFPLGYWNGLAIFVALGVPLLLHAAVTAAGPLRRGLALAPVPAIAAVVYLASSRGGAAAAACGVLALLVLASDRWAVLAALVPAVVASAAAVLLLGRLNDLVNGPLGTSAASSQGHTGAAIVLVACAAAGAAWGAAVRLGPVRRPAAAVGWAALAVVVVVVVAGAALSHPAARFAAFKQPPGAVSFSAGNFVQAHLVSGSGSGRWQFWGSAIDQWRAHPLLGEGAGSFGAWWAQHAPITYYISDAHSLYLEQLGELGVVGGLLTLLLIGIPLVAGGRLALRARGRERDALAAGTAGLVAYAVGAGLDWMWELTVVSVVGFALAGLLVAAPRDGDAAPARPGRRARPTFALGVLALVLAWGVIFAAAIELGASVKVGDSQAAARAGDLSGALSSARTAKSIEPWAASPYQQLALVEEQAGELPSARRSIQSAISRSRHDWQLWLAAARIDTELGRVADARTELHRARELNPRSPLFAHLQQAGGS